MTVPVNDRRIQYSATSGQTTFVYDFEIEANTEITVLQTFFATGLTSTLVLTTDYSVTGVENPSGGNIVLVTGASTGDIITIIGNTPLSRVTDFNDAGDFLASELNGQFDKITRILQENETETDRSVLLAPEDTVDSITLPITSERASKFLGFDASGEAIAALPTGSGVPVSPFMQTLLDDSSAAEGRTTLDCQEDVVTTRGDMIRGSSLGEAERLPIGSANYLVKSDGTDISWGFEVLDEDDMSSDSATKLATQQSIKAYIDSLTSERPCIMVFLSADQTVTTGVTTKIELDSIIIDEGSYFDAAQYRWVPPAGRYAINYGVLGVDAGTAVQGIRGLLYLNGAPHQYQRDPEYDGANATVCGSIIIDMNGTDYLEVYGVTGGTDAVDIGGGRETFLSGFKL